MRTKNSFFGRLAWALVALVCLYTACDKQQDPANPIQQGPVTVEINVIYPGHIQVRYGRVLDVPIDLQVALQLSSGGHEQIHLRIPAGYKNLRQWTGDGYLNIWDYLGGGSDSTTGSSTPLDPSWDIISADIVSVSCQDSEYGFKVLTGADEWTSLYHPTDSVTTVRFVVNKDTVDYSDYDFNLADAFLYRKTTSLYGMAPFHYQIQLFAGPAAYPLEEGMELAVPFFLYHQGARDIGSAFDGEGSDKNGSTLTMTITRVTDTHFSAVFSGKIWSPRQPDTLVISGGSLTSAPLPVIQ